LCIHTSNHVFPTHLFFMHASRSQTQRRCASELRVRCHRSQAMAPLCTVSLYNAQAAAGSRCGQPFSRFGLLASRVACGEASAPRACSRPHTKRGDAMRRPSFHILAPCGSYSMSDACGMRPVAVARGLRLRRCRGAAQPASCLAATCACDAAAAERGSGCRACSRQPRLVACALFFCHFASSVLHHQHAPCTNSMRN
jgi:hypothetical protein